jgi:excinuclease ABC subunit C
VSHFDAKEFLDSVTTLPGVYQMFDEHGEVIYIGKAINLKNRLRSYFSGGQLAPKTVALVKQIADIKITIARSDYEALLIESNLIKQYLPRYNVLLRDDKSYPYITLSKSAFPRLDSYRGAKRSSYEYFGPYPSGTAVRETLKLLQKLFQLRQCRDSFFKQRSRPCLQHQIGRCSAPCVNKIAKEVYAEQVDLARLFLEGKSQKVIEQLMENMEQASVSQSYEKAARFRDLIVHLREIQAKQYVTSGDSNADVFAIAEYRGQFGVGVQLIRHGQLVSNQTHTPKVPLHYDRKDVLTSFVSQYYFGDHGVMGVPEEIVLNSELNDSESFSEAVNKKTNKKISIKSVVRGRRAKWLETAKKAAEHHLMQRYHQLMRETERLAALKEMLNLGGNETNSCRIECFDISHMMGEATVASCVVFENGVPVKSLYRRFNITGITPGDDYAAMESALMRRYSRLIKEEARLPDLLIVDGGRGQLAKAESVIEELQIADMVVLGVAKGPSRKEGLEQLFLIGEELPLDVDRNHPGLLLIQYIRDEAHRFAITGHRGRRSKARKQSSLEDIAGVGEKRRQSLLKHFGGLQGVRKAAIEDIAKVVGISKQLAREVFAYFHELP